MAISDKIPGSGRVGDFLPRINCDARNGFLSKVVRTQTADGWKSELHSLQFPLTLQIDFANIEIIWLGLVNGVDVPAVKYRDVIDGTATVGDRPSEDHKPGFRLRVYNNSLLDGVHEWSSTALCVRAAIDKLHDLYEAQADEHLDEAPLVHFTGVTAVTTPRGTNYAPDMTITGGAPRDTFDALPAPQPAPAAAPAAEAAGASTSQAVFS